ncbi:PREDICTED: WAT1-related protein At1g68170-like [Nicotiana attenuata]|uniref:WAT1-related protein n=1 Tax=Nicotiana attenuata TaxID=49451 RepID=A0A314KXJ6_NICAT|nr:PREDICTED: WAT1-related protein At1g68170-like [Nicotiana attenuata]OIT34241.1 wat1-related protein [Nicotiana attenuata]
MASMENICNVVHEMRPLLLMILGQIILAGMNIVFKLATSDGMNFSILIFYRCLFASVFMVPLAFFIERGKRAKLTKMVIFQGFLCGLLGGSLGQNMYLQSLVYTSATFVSAMFNLIPAITFVVAIILRLEKLGLKTPAGKAKVLGTLVCISGAMLLTLYKGPEINIGKTNINLLHSTHHKGESKPLAGALLALAGCTCYALLLIVQAKAAQRYPCPYSFTALLNVMAAVQCFVVAVVVERDWKEWKLGWNVRLLASAYTGIFCSGVLFTIIAWVVRMKGPVYVSVFNPLMLVMVAISGYLFLEEKLYLGSVLGSIVIVCGLYVVLWGKDKEIKKLSQLVPDKEETDIKSSSVKDSSHGGSSKREVKEDEGEENKRDSQAGSEILGGTYH